MQHDKYAIINNRMFYFGKRTADTCDETAPTLEQAMSIVVRMIEEGEDDISIVEFIEKDGKTVAEGREVQFNISGNLEMFESLVY